MSASDYPMALRPMPINYRTRQRAKTGMQRIQK